MTLARYVRRRNGVDLGARGSLRNMLRRSLGAGSFAGFWRSWNPVFGYLLARWVHAPLLGIFPRSVAVVGTFVVCGAFHDLVTTVLRGSVAFLFTPWFFFLGVGVVLGGAVGMDLGRRPWWLRACVHLAYIATCLALALAATTAVR